MNDLQLAFVKKHARMFAKKWGIPQDEALQHAVLCALEHPRWWTDKHTDSWRKQAIGAYLYTKYIRNPKRHLQWETDYHNGLPPNLKRRYA